MDLKKQVEQLEAQLAGKESQVASLVERTQELGAFRAEALTAREALAELNGKVADLEAAVVAAKSEAASLKSAAASSDAKNSASQAKVEAAVKLSEALRVLIG